MKHVHGLTIALLAGMSMAGCSQPPAPPVPPSAPPPPAAAADESFIGRQVGKAIAEARHELATQNISVGDGVDININGRKIHSEGSGNLPKAEITPQGELLIEGKAVATNAAQRAELLAYRGQILGIAEAGMAIGAQGANIAGHALNGVVGAIFGGKDGERAFEQKIEAEASKIEAEAMKLCSRLPALMAGQQSLARAVPEFKPYARMTQADIDDCGKDTGKGKGVSVTSS